MPNVIFIIVALIVCLIGAILVVRYKKAVKFLEQNLDNIHGQIDAFNSEYADIQKHYVLEPEEKAFSEKWFGFYSEISKCRLPKKHSAYIINSPKNCKLYLL